MILYKEHPTMENTFPHEGVFRLTTPLKCQSGTFSEGDIVKLEYMGSDDSQNTIEYKAEGTDGQKIIIEYFTFNGSIEQWNAQFIPEPDSSDLYTGINAIKEKRDKASDTEDIMTGLLFLLSAPIMLCIIIPLAAYWESWEGSSLASTVAFVSVSLGVFTAIMLTGLIARRKVEKALKEENEYQLGYFLTKLDK